MGPRPLVMSSNYLAVVRGLRELHRLRTVEREDSPEADAVRDATDLPWEGLTEEEKKRLSGLSEDLYSVSNQQRPTVLELKPQAQSRLVDAVQAQQRGEWDRVFEILRRWADYIDPALLSYLRGATWLEAGDPETASLFLEHASVLQPDNGKYLARFLTSLSRFDPIAAKRRAEAILNNPGRHPAHLVVYAASVVMVSAHSLPETEASQLFERLIPVLELSQTRLGDGDEGGVDLSIYSMACGFLGFCHEYLGRNQAALRHYSEGLVASPSNHELLMARGRLLYGGSPQAVHDLELAIEHGPSDIWPYFFLAHHNLASGLFEQCRSFSQRALELDGPDALKSELAEWLAISQSELGFPIEIVRESFETSIRFDPTNERARRNLAAFEAAAKPVPASVYETRGKSAIRASGLSGRRLRPAA